MKELIRVSVQYASRQQCCKTYKRPLPLPFTFHMGVKLGLTHCRMNKGLGFLRIFMPKRDEVTGEWRRLQKEELNDL